MSQGLPSGSKGWTIFNEERDCAIYIGPDGAFSLSFDGQATWQEVGRLTDPESTAMMLVQMLGTKRVPCN